MQVEDSRVSTSRDVVEAQVMGDAGGRVAGGGGGVGDGRWGPKRRSRGAGDRVGLRGPKGAEKGLGFRCEARGRTMRGRTRNGVLGGPARGDGGLARRSKGAGGGNKRARGSGGKASGDGGKNRGGGVRESGGGWATAAGSSGRRSSCVSGVSGARGDKGSPSLLAARWSLASASRIVVSVIRFAPRCSKYCAPHMCCERAVAGTVFLWNCAMSNLA